MTMFSDLKLQDKPTGDWTLKRLRQARSKGRDLVFLVSKKELEPFLLTHLAYKKSSKTN